MTGRRLQSPGTLVLPEGWYLLWCDECLAAIAWTEADVDEADEQEWGETLNWAVRLHWDEHRDEQR